MNYQPMIKQILCVALVASIMMPVGRMVFPHISAELSGMEFKALEAVATATIGFGIYAIFG
jgi:hypothetical protein